METNKENYKQEVKVNTYTVTDVENTPFSIVEDENRCVIVMGKNIVSDINFENAEKAREYIESKPWNLTFAMMAVFCERYEEMKKYERENKNNS